MRIVQQRDLILPQCFQLFAEGREADTTHLAKNFGKMIYGLKCMYHSLSTGPKIVACLSFDDLDLLVSYFAQFVVSLNEEIRELCAYNFPVCYCISYIGEKSHV